MQNPQVVVVGGGHNGLVAAAYLARAGLTVTVLEASDRFGGAVASGEPFAGVAARLSRFSYLVSLLPRRLAADLELDLELRSRRVASYTPAGDSGLFVERVPGPATEASFSRFGGDSAFAAWGDFESQLHDLAQELEPTLMQPLPTSLEVRELIGGELWWDLVERPLGEWLEQDFDDDTVRGVLLTDALIGTFADAHEPDLRQNRCFLYHVIGRGTGEWQVPIGGMGRVASALERAARQAGAELIGGAAVVAVETDTGGGATVRLADGRSWSAPWVLANCAPYTLDRLRGRAGIEPPVGCQTKVNLLLRRLPRLRSGLAPEDAFAGTLHLGQGYGRLAEAYAEAVSGRIPDPLPCEVYCHTLTDPTILAPELAGSGHHTLTVFGLHTPIDLFRADPDGSRRTAEAAALRSLQEVLAEPLADVLATDRDGRPCVETLTPLDLEREVRLPGGHIFHGDLAWPWLAEGETATDPAARWGVQTDHPGLLLCGSGARRGGAVSGLGGHNAAMAVQEQC